MRLPSPFYASAEIGRAAPRLLLLSYHFAPSEAAGALRWQKLASQVAARGWGLDVVTLDPGLLATRDDGRLADLPNGTRVFGAAPSRLKRERIELLVSRAASVWRSWHGRSARRGGPPTERAHADSIAASDAKGPLHSAADLRRAFNAMDWYARDKAWADAAALLAIRVAAGHTYLAVVTCGPPHMIHLAGSVVARRLRAPLVLDFRDPWSLVERLPEPFGSTLWWTLAARHEGRAVRHAALLVTNTEAHSALLGRRYPDIDARIIAVLNGFDREPVPPPRDDHRFTLAYAGSIYLDRDPRPLLAAAALVVRKRNLSPNDLHILFIGEVKSYAGAALGKIAEDAGLSAFIEIQGPRPRREALVELARADQLVVLPQDSHLAVPSKLYEYMTFPAWILAIASAGSAVATTLANTGADVVAPGDVDAMAAAIDARLAAKMRGGRPVPLATSVPHLSRERQATKLLDALEDLWRSWRL